MGSDFVTGMGYEATHSKIIPNLGYSLYACLAAYETYPHDVHKRLKSVVPTRWWSLAYLYKSKYLYIIRV